MSLAGRIRKEVTKNKPRAERAWAGLEVELLKLDDGIGREHLRYGINLYRDILSARACCAVIAQELSSGNQVNAGKVCQAIEIAERDLLYRLCSTEGGSWLTFVDVLVSCLEAPLEAIKGEDLSSPRSFAHSVEQYLDVSGVVLAGGGQGYSAKVRSLIGCISAGLFFLSASMRFRLENQCY